MLSAINRSVRYKLMAVILATTLAALLVAALALLSYEVRTYREFLVTDATTQADILARISAPALQFGDPEAAAEHLTLLASRRGIIAAAIYTADGELVASYARADAEVEFPSLASPQGSRLAGDTLELFHPIVVSDRVIGTIYLRATHDLLGRLHDYLLILAAVMLLSMVVAGAISLRLQRSVTAPVLAVSGVARKVVEDRDFALRAPRTTDDEIGVLVDSFNTMLAEVGRMTEALEATNRRLTEETEERKAAVAALRAADRRKDEFLATLAHELRNPLAPMVNALRMIEATDPGTDAGRARGIIERQLGNMIRLVDDLLDVSRITRGKLALHRQSVELSSVVQSAFDTARPAIESRQHELEVRLPDAPVYLDADPMRLSQVFSNLLSNAAKYTEPGGRITLSASVRDAEVEIVITDTGIGMSEATLQTIFEMFTQGAGAKEGTEGGLGVGLALSRRLVELHGGAIEAKSEGPGRGSTFVVRLALAAQSAPAAPAEPIGPAAPAAPRRILLVDDNVDFATSLAVLLESAGHQVRVAHDADGALAAARELRPHIAFLDIGLPAISGHELAGRLRAQPGVKGIVLVALSGWGQEEDRRRSRRAGFAAHLVKPVDLAKILEVLDSVGPAF